MSTVTGTTPRIYVASLTDYNAGRLVGEWIDADQSADAIREEITEMLRTAGETHGVDIYNGPREEWAIHDHEGFAGISIAEYESIDVIAELGQLVAEHGEAFALYVADVGTDATGESFEEAYAGEWESPEEYAEELYSDIYDKDVTDGPLWSYVDWERVAHDLSIDGYTFAPSSTYTVHVFRAI